MISDIYDLTECIVKWRKTVLDDAHPTGMLSKLVEELEELKEKPCDGHELADIMIILLDYCDTVGVDIVKAVHYKMEINRERTWRIDNDGKLQHKRPDEGESPETLAYCRRCERTITIGTPMECNDFEHPDCRNGRIGRSNYTPSHDEGSDS